ncbi:leucyl/phenylalanyl-tRNA--protein transferase [Piscinibacter sakaiensis]|uniref:leucyl/phenylalanyl-tRNA--protein transferase n=1 Tax=Piscinibacter sakaiensis TaxID=1547922 RepID=UPI003AAF541E
MITWLQDDQDPLPDTSTALPADSDAPGLLAAGGQLSPQRLREAYSHGIFPWYGEGQPVLWWSPDPRMVLQTARFKPSRSLRKTLARFIRSPGCAIRIDSAFPQVIGACAGSIRDGQQGTWIVPEMIQAYCRWHELGAVHSVETWIDGELAGGLYGVNLGRMFFGESMFARRSDASKIALAALVCFCRSNAIAAIDCQQNTAHLASLGAAEMARGEFERHLRATVDLQPPADWSYHPVMWQQLAGPQIETTRPEDPGQ